MRAVLTVDLPTGFPHTQNSTPSPTPPNPGDGEYPSEALILRVIRSFGWEPVEIQQLSDESAKKQKYQAMAADLFKDMPEIAAAESEHAIFYGYFGGEQTKFVVTRPVVGQITFRLLHPILPRLQTSAEKLVRKILNSRLLGGEMEVSNQLVVVYERGHDNIIVHGRVIPRAWRETFRSNLKDTILALGSASLFIPVTAVIPSIESVDLRTWMERLSTALFTAALVSALGLVTSYWDIRTNRVIAWDIADPSD